MNFNKDQKVVFVGKNSPIIDYGQVGKFHSWSSDEFPCLVDFGRNCLTACRRENVMDMSAFTIIKVLNEVLNEQ